MRVQALRALAVAVDTEHVDRVRGLLEDADESVRRQAARVLEQMAARLDGERDLWLGGA